MRRIVHITRLAGLITGIVSTPSHAVDQLPLEETVIVASRVATSSSATGVSVTTLDRELIERFAYPDLAELLDTQAGLSVAQGGGFGGAASVRIRGEEGFRTRVMLDGIDIADPSSPQISPRFEHLLTSGIGRVEVLRGPQGLLWGADAGGVVSISSLLPTQGFDGRVRLESGARGYGLASATIAAGNERFAGSASLARLGTDGFNARRDDSNDPDNDGYKNTSGHVTGKVSVSDAVALQATLYDISGDNEYDGCFNSSTFTTSNDCRDTFSQRAWRLASDLDLAGQQHQLAVSQNKIERDLLTAERSSYATTGKTGQISYLGSTAIADSLRMTWGIDHSSQRFADDFNNGGRDNTGVYGELMQDFRLASWSAAVRHDDNDDFGTFTSWRLSGVHQVPGAHNLSLRAAIGTGFRAPSLYEIAYNRSPSASPPAAQMALEAEDSRGWEVAFRYDSSDIDIEIVGFDQAIDNAIFFDLAGFSGYLQSPGESRSRGIETIFHYALNSAITLDGNATWNRAEDNDGAQRAYRPEFTARLSMLWAANRWRGSVTLRTARDSVDNMQQPIDDYVLLDAVLSYQLGDNLELAARVENLGDTDYTQVVPFNSPGRAGYVSIQYGI